MEVTNILGMESHTLNCFCLVRYKLSQEDADAVSLMAKRTQVNDVNCKHPVSLINIWSPLGLLPTGPETNLRCLAVEYATELPEGHSSLDVLKSVYEKLKSFGIQSLKIDCKWRRLIEAELAKLGMTQENAGDINRDWLVCYHSMLWKTGQGWTYRRTPEEMSIKSGYHPNILGVFGDIACVETRLSGERLETLNLEAGQLDGDLATLIGNYDNWKKIGIMEFFARVITVGLPLAGPTSQRTVAITVGDGNQWGCVPATQASIDRGEQSWPNVLSPEEFILTSSMKRLYDIRPEAIVGMSFAQFVAQYRLVDKGGREEKEMEKKVGRQNTVGPPSNTTIAGTTALAPTIVKFSNSRFVTKRKHEEGNLLPMVKCMDQTLDDKTKRYLFKPWCRPERVMQEEEFDAAEMKECDEVRLQLFPTSFIG